MATKPLLDWEKMLPTAQKPSTQYDPAKQIQGYQRRIEGAGLNAEAAGDTRNAVEKALNLKPNQNTFWDIIEIINRPQQAIFAGIEASQKGKDVGKAMLEGISGNTAITGKDLILGSSSVPNVFQDRKGKLDLVDVAGFALDIFADPIDIPLLPISGAASLATNILQKADDIAKIPDAVKAVQAGFDVLNTNKKLLKLKFDSVEQFADVLAATKMTPAQYIKEVGSSIRRFQTPLEGAFRGIGKGLDLTKTGFDNVLTKAFEAYDEALLVDPKFAELSKEAFDATYSFKGKYKNFKEGMQRFVEKLSPFSKKFDYKNKKAKGAATLSEMELMYNYEDFFNNKLPDMARKEIANPNSIYFEMTLDDAIKKLNEDLMNFGEIKGRFKPMVSLDQYLKEGRSKWQDVIATQTADYFEGMMRYILKDTYDDDFYRQLFRRQRMPNGEIGVFVNEDLMEDVASQMKKKISSLPSELNVQKNLTKKVVREQAKAAKQQELLKVRELKNADVENLKPIKQEFIRKEKIRRQLIKEASMTPDELAANAKRQARKTKQVANVLAPERLNEIAAKQQQIQSLTDELTQLSNRINQIEGNINVLAKQERQYISEILRDLHLDSPNGFDVNLSDAQQALESGKLKLKGEFKTMEEYLAKVDTKDIRQVGDASKDAVIKEVERVGGVTVKEGKIIDASSGYQVGIDKVTEQSFEKLDDLMDAVAEAGYKDYGVWKSPTTGRWVLDPSSRYVNDLDDALNIGTQAKQVTVWDWGKKQEWNVKTKQPIKMPKTPGSMDGGSTPPPTPAAPKTSAPTTPAATPAASAFKGIPDNNVFLLAFKASDGEPLTPELIRSMSEKVGPSIVKDNLFGLRKRLVEKYPKANIPSTKQISKIVDDAMAELPAASAKPFLTLPNGEIIDETVVKNTIEQYGVASTKKQIQSLRDKIVKNYPDAKVPSTQELNKTIDEIGKTVPAKQRPFYAENTPNDYPIPDKLNGTDQEWVKKQVREFKQKLINLSDKKSNYKPGFTPKEGSKADDFRNDLTAALDGFIIPEGSSEHDYFLELIFDTRFTDKQYSDLMDIKDEIVQMYRKVGEDDPYTYSVKLRQQAEGIRPMDLPTAPTPTVENLPTATPKVEPVVAAPAATPTAKVPGRVRKYNTDTFKAADEYINTSRTKLRDAIEGANFTDLPETPKTDSMIYQRYEELRDRFEEVFGADDEMNDLLDSLEGYLPEKKHQKIMDMIDEYANAGGDEFLENRNRMEEIFDQLNDSTIDDVTREVLSDELDELSDTIQTQLNDGFYQGDLPDAEDFTLDEEFKVATPEEREVAKRGIDILNANGKVYKNVKKIDEDLIKEITIYKETPVDQQLTVPLASGRQIQVKSLKRNRAAYSFGTDYYVVYLDDSPLFNKIGKYSDEPEVDLTITQAAKKVREAIKADLAQLDGKTFDAKALQTEDDWLADEIAKKDPNFFKEVPKKAEPTLEGLPKKVEPEVVKTPEPAYNKVEETTQMVKTKGTDVSGITDRSAKMTANRLYKTRQSLNEILNMSYEDLTKSNILNQQQLLDELNSFETDLLPKFNSFANDEVTSQQLMKFINDNNINIQEVTVASRINRYKLAVARHNDRLLNISPEKYDEILPLVLRDVDTNIDQLKKLKTVVNQNLTKQNMLEDAAKYDAMFDKAINDIENTFKKAKADNQTLIVKKANEAAEKAKALAAEKAKFADDVLPEEIVKLNPEVAKIPDKAVKQKIVKDLDLIEKATNMQEYSFERWLSDVKRWETNEKMSVYKFRNMVENVDSGFNLRNRYLEQFPNLTKEQGDEIWDLFREVNRKADKILDSQHVAARYNIIDKLNTELGNTTRTGKKYYQEQFISFLDEELKGYNEGKVILLRSVKNPIRTSFEGINGYPLPYADFKFKITQSEKGIELRKEVLKLVKKHTSDRSLIYKEISQTNLDYPNAYKYVEQIKNYYKFHDDAIVYAKKTLPKGSATEIGDITGALGTQFAALPEANKTVAAKYYKDYKYATKIKKLSPEGLLKYGDDFGDDFFDVDYKTKSLVGSVSSIPEIPDNVDSSLVRDFITNLNEKAYREDPSLYEMAALKQDIYNFFTKDPMFTKSSIKDVAAKSYLSVTGEKLDNTIIEDMKKLTSLFGGYKQELKYLNAADSEKYARIGELIDEIYTGDTATDKVVKAFEEFRKELNMNELAYGKKNINVQAMKRVFYKLEQRKFVEEVAKSKALERLIRGE